MAHTGGDGVRTACRTTTVRVNAVRCVAAMPCLTTMDIILRRALACSAATGRLYKISFKKGSTACYSGVTSCIEKTQILTHESAHNKQPGRCPT